MAGDTGLCEITDDHGYACRRFANHAGDCISGRIPDVCPRCGIGTVSTSGGRTPAKCIRAVCNYVIGDELEIIQLLRAKLDQDDEVPREHAPTNEEIRKELQSSFEKLYVELKRLCDLEEQKFAEDLNIAFGNALEEYPGQNANREAAARVKLKWSEDLEQERLRLQGDKAASRLAHALEVPPERATGRVSSHQWQQFKDAGYDIPPDLLQEGAPRAERMVTLGKETRSTSSTGAQKGVKQEQYDQIPVMALQALAVHYGRGAAKYEAHNFRLGFEWSKSFNAAFRHLLDFWSGKDFDVCSNDPDGCSFITIKGEPFEPTMPDTCYNHTGSHHLISGLWQLSCLYSFTEEHPEFDDRLSTLRRRAQQEES
jgi:hypothetical protein